MKRVYLAIDMADAYAARGRLWAEGIHAIIRGRDLSAMRNLQFRQEKSPTLWVDDPDEKRAEHILRGSSGR